MIGSVIVSLHVATGAAAGALTRSRPAALLLGPLVHLAGDRVPHDDIEDLGFEIGRTHGSPKGPLLRERR